MGAVAFAAPLLLGLLPRLRLPAAVLEIVAGIVLGPSVLGWVQVDEPISILALLGLAFLLFLAGLEIDFHRLRGRLSRLASLGFVVSLVVALAVALTFRAVGLVENALLVAIMLAATSLGLVVPVLADSGRAESDLGQLVIGAASIADFGAIILLSLLFSGEAGGQAATAVLLGGVAVLAVLVGLVLAGVTRYTGVSSVLVRLQDTTAQIRVRGAVVLMLLFVVLAERLGLEVILGAFVAGGILRLVDRDMVERHPQTRTKLEALGYGFLIPVFFVSSGLRFDLEALLNDPSAVARIPVFLAGLLLARGIPALLYRRVLGRREVAAAALLQATSLPFIVAAAEIGLALEVLAQTTASAMIAAGLLSVVAFPPVALGLLRRDQDSTAAANPTSNRRHHTTAVE
ncbi:MAG: cation:proton antiporter [Actinomycetota bacterium]